jgi:REP element-mobilizing transposase RayT
MPQKGMRWRHVVINTHATWLHGDAKGFRSRGHRIHSSGDYKNRPPGDEHAELHLHHEGRSVHPTRLRTEFLGIVGQAILDSLQKKDLNVIAMSVSADHVHALVELPDNVPAIKKIIGWCKWYGTRAVSEQIQGELWADGCSYKPVDDRSHHRTVYNYILTKQKLPVWTWSIKIGEKLRLK